MCASRIDDIELRVLLVEDNADDAFLLERHLSRNGFRPAMTRVETAGQMLAALEQTPLPHIILADYNLPSFSGPAALQVLRSKGMDIPFIMLSGAVSEETAVEAMRSGAQDYVSKQNLLRLIPAIHRELKEAATRLTRLETEKALVASEARFASLVEMLPLGLLIVDASGRCLYANRSVESLLGYGAEELTSGTVALVSLSSALSADHQALLSAPSRTEPREIACTRADGTQVDTLAGMSVLNPDAELGERQIAITLVDLTLQKKSEEVIRRTEKLAVAGRLAASISHEINNPLEAVTNCLYLLSKGDLSPTSSHYLELAQQELNRVSQITVQTLRFYRSSTRVTRTDVHELIASVLALLEGRLKQGDVTVIRDLKAESTFSGHDGEIRQTIVNLIGNAIDAVSPGGVIKVRTRTLRDAVSGKKGIALTIADDGSGIDAAVQKRIFEPFYSTKGITGTGLGLWISREIIDKHEGSIRLRSRRRTAECRGGSVFRVFLPSEMDGEASSERSGGQRAAIAGMPKLTSSLTI